MFTFTLSFSVSIKLRRIESKILYLNKQIHTFLKKEFQINFFTFTSIVTFLCFEHKSVIRYLKYHINQSDKKAAD